jgi:hypothetical protein
MVTVAPGGTMRVLVMVLALSTWSILLIPVSGETAPPGGSEMTLAMHDPLTGSSSLRDSKREKLELDCDDALVCPLEPIDDFLAWKLVRQTSIPYRMIASARADGQSWAEALRALEVEPWEALAALGSEELVSDGPLDDDLLQDAALGAASGVRLPSFGCELPVTIIGVRDPRLQSEDDFGFGANGQIDYVAEAIADRISDETGWCRDELLEALGLLGSWTKVARDLYLSPYLFEASFGLDVVLETVGDEVLVRYPRDEDIHDIAERGAWPEAGRR